MSNETSTPNPIAQRRRTGYRVLLCLLFIVVPALLWVCRWQEENVEELSVSADGTRIAVLSRFGYSTRSRVTIWDHQLTLLKSYPIQEPHAVGVALSAHGDLVAVATDDREGEMAVHFIDVGSGKRRKQVISDWLSRFGLLFFSADDSMLVAAGFRTLVGVPVGGGGQTVHENLGNGGIEYVSRDGSKLGVFAAGEYPGTQTLEVYDISPQAIDQSELVTVETVPLDQPEAVALGNSGSVVMSHIGKDSFTEIWQGDRRATTETGFDVHAIDFALDQSSLISFRGRSVERVDLVTMESRKLAEHSPKYEFDRVLADDYVLGLDALGAYRFTKLHQLDLRKGTVQTRRLQMVDKDRFRGVAIGVLTLAAMWMFFWVKNGLTSRWRWRPLVDATIFNVMIGVGLVMHVYWAELHRESIAVGVMIHWLATVFTLAILLQVFSDVAAPKCLSLFLLLIAVIWRSLEQAGVYDVRLYSVVIGFTLIVFLYCCGGFLKSLGVRVVWLRNGASHTVGLPRSQMSIFDLMMITASIAGVSFAARMSQLNWVPMSSIGYLMLFAAALAAFLLLLAWLSLVKTLPSMRFLTLVSGALLLAMSTRWAGRAVDLPDLEWHIISLSVAGAIFGATLAIFRFHGYRIVWAR